MRIEEIEAREKAATNTAAYWEAPWRMKDTVEIRASWFQPLVSDIRKASGLSSDLLAELKEAREKLKTVEEWKERNEHESKWPDFVDWPGLDRILKGSE